MIPQSQPKKPKNSGKANLVISAIFHALLLGAAFYFAARTGMLGEKMKSITVEKVPPKPKPPEEIKKPEPPKEVPKVVQPKVVEVAKPATPPPAALVAPPAAVVPGLNFSDGAKAVNSETDPVKLYKGYMEYKLRQQWNRPEDMADDKFVAEVAVAVDQQGNISHPQWLNGSGNEKWDKTVKDVFKVVTSIDRRPPTNFPPNVTIRFDVAEETEPVMRQ